MAINGNASRPFEGPELDEVLKDLARINTLAASLKLGLEPNTSDDAATSAEPPLTLEHIQAGMDVMLQIIARTVSHHIKAEPVE